MLFDNNNDDLNYNFFDLTNLTNNINKYQKNNNFNLFSSKDGFLRGNMFKNEYKPYNNLTFINIKPKNDREAKLFNVMQYSFAINDLNLYLDINPLDMETLNVLKQLINEETKAKKDYINSYGPLNICDTEGNSFEWINNPWPWDDLGGNKYV